MPATLLRAHRRFLVVDELIGSSVVNFVINGAIAWIVFHGAARVARASLVGDTLVTAFVLPFLTALIVPVVVRVQLAVGKLPPLALDGDARPAWLPHSNAARGALLGAAAVAIVGAPAAMAMALLAPAQLSLHGFIWCKAAFAASLGALVTPPVGWWALVDASRPAGVNAA
jgi:hypothetical protein